MNISVKLLPNICSETAINAMSVDENVIYNIIGRSCMQKI